VILDTSGIPICNSFKFTNNYQGFNSDMWKIIKSHIKDLNTNSVVFAVEISINLWQKLCAFLSSKGFTVLMVSPLFTHHERPKINNNFSRTDPKDALAVANCTRQGYFNFYKNYCADMDAMHRLSITYDKLKEHVAQIKQRIRSQVELIFPELLETIDIDTDTVRLLLRKYLSPEEFRNMNIFLEALECERVSQRQHGFDTLKRIKEAAQNSIGIKLNGELLLAEKLTLHCWLNQLSLLKEQIKLILDQMVTLAKQTPFFNIISSLKGVSDITAARFIAELRDPSLFNHYKKIEAFAGINLRLSQSGQFTGYRRITHIGNHRLRAILYTMAEETKNHIPEVRIRYLKRQMKQFRYRKNVTACISNVLKLVTSMMKENHKYSYNQEHVAELTLLEEQYKEFKKNKKYKRSA
ncbi:MAG: transposase, partial [Melioribacter sp.]|nr:transposase [Melioribacter sp.]